MWDARALVLLDSGDLAAFLARFGGNKIAWAVEEVLNVDADGGEWLVERLLGEVWTVTLGWGDAVIEIDVTFAPAPMLPSHTSDRAVPQHAHRSVPLSALAMKLEQVLASTIGEITMVHDPNWQQHRHPFADLLRL